jgi:hypothetical protein
MLDIIDTLCLTGELADAGISSVGENFEDTYARVASDPDLKDLRWIIEKRVADYFGTMQLPDEPTIYDYLVLSLRAKDAIATFNWDPFLYQALERNHEHASLPMFFFLHGCAAIAWCERHKQQGLLGRCCTVCGRQYTPTRLLYPVSGKDYVSDPYIRSQWRSVQAGHQKAFLLTIFGYGAPESDAAAIDLMSGAWGKPAERSLEEVEIIDIKPEDQLAKTWDRFIHSHHYTVSSDYFQSILAMHPRRSVEAYWQSLVEARFREQNWVPRARCMSELWDWFEPLVKAEDQQAIQ